MGSIASTVRSRQVGETLEEVRETLDREVVPVLGAAHREINLLSGDTTAFTDDDDEATLARTGGVVIASNALAATVYLPVPDEDLADKRITVVRGGAGALDIELASGADISGSATWSPSQYGGNEFFCDGAAWWVIGAF